jgi:hypothetical protein
MVDRERGEVVPDLVRRARQRGVPQAFAQPAFDVVVHRPISRDRSESS